MRNLATRSAAVLCAIALISTSALAQTRSDPAAKDQQPAEQPAKPDPGLQFLGNVLELIKKAKEDEARRKAAEQAAKPPPAPPAETTTTTTQPEPQPAEPAPVATKPEPERPTPAAKTNANEPRPAKPERPEPQPKQIEPGPEQVAPPPLEQMPAPVVPTREPIAPLAPTPAPARVADDGGPWGWPVVIAILALLAALAGGVGYALRGRFFFVPPLPGATAYADVGTAGAPDFDGPQLTVLIARASFSAVAEYPKAAE